MTNRGLIHSLVTTNMFSDGAFYFLQGEVGSPGGQGPPGPVGNAGPSGITLIGVSRKVAHRKHDCRPSGVPSGKCFLYALL